MVHFEIITHNPKIRTADEIAADALDDILTPKGSLKKLG